VVDIRLDAARETVEELRLRTLDGREGRVRGRRFVLAAGGLETARLLLNAQVGSDWVGRCFMEHPHISAPPFRADPGRDFTAYTGRGQDAWGRPFTVCIGVSEEIRKRERLLNARAHLYRTPLMNEDAPPRLGLFCEQQPHPDSRATLTDDRDAVGLRRLRLDWRLTDLDWASYERSAAIIGETAARLGLGTWDKDIGLCARAPSNVLHSNHHLGTTRMSAELARGVVDPNARMHGLDNLYIAGGSIMPTSSWANPTLTVTALILKLADHFRGRL
jgi:choline dehydrogenase-like flavoprotein